MSQFVQGEYVPQNREKYVGKDQKIFCRSSWEVTFCRYCDLNPAIRKWASESIVIPYYDPTTGKERKYYVDFYIENYKGERMLVEVKPKRETKKPKISKNKKQSTIIYETKTYAKNQAKWDAAKKWCEKRGMKFIVITEKNFNF
jgi:hypothetical protein